MVGEPDDPYTEADKVYLKQLNQAHMDVPMYHVLNEVVIDRGPSP